MTDKKLTEKIIVQERVKSSSGSSIYILIPKAVREHLGLTENSTYKLIFDPKKNEGLLTFIGD